MIRIPLISIAIGMLFLHALIPHSHHGELTPQQHQITHEQANGLIDHLGLALQTGSESNLIHYLLATQEAVKPNKKESTDHSIVKSKGIGRSACLPFQGIETGSSLPLFYGIRSVNAISLRAPPAV